MVCHRFCLLQTTDMSRPFNHFKLTASNRISNLAEPSEIAPQQATRFSTC
ncbi:Uncharacterised protein [Vibrio cholerae]|nr:Uncharacterised protein [Vibrio cholerae]